MGCFGSRVAFFRSCSLSANTSRQNSRRQNIFAVQNVDDTGQRVSPGKLEVTETDLVLHVKGKPSLTWPLRCLRRYGYDNDLFSFESGRRCPTGAGIFAFRCHRAQSLFNLLQAKIQGNPGALPTVPSTPITPPNTGTPINAGNNSNAATAASTPASSTFVYVNLAESNSSRLISAANPANNPLSSFPTHSSNDPPDVVQTPSTTISKELSQPGIIITNSTSATSNRGPQQHTSLLISGKPTAVSENHPVYMNVESHGGALFAAGAAGASSNYQNNISSIPPPTAPRRNTLSSEMSVVGAAAGPSLLSTTSSSSSSTAGHNPMGCALYSNVFCNHNNKGATSTSATSSYGNSLHRFGGGGGITLIQQEPAEINYAELDLKTDRPSSSSSNNSPYSSRLGLINKHHQLLSASASAATGAGGKSSADDLANSGSSLSGSSTSKTIGANYIPPRLANSQQQNNGELGYATIDFDKTAALSKTTRSKITLGFGENQGSSSSKKSRHGSTGL